MVLRSLQIQGANRDCCKVSCYVCRSFRLSGLGVVRECAEVQCGAESIVLWGNGGMSDVRQWDGGVR